MSEVTVDDPTHTLSHTLRPTVDALELILGNGAVPILDHGFLRVVDYMGDDNAVVQAARVSYGRGTKKLQEDVGLIRYMRRHAHCYHPDMEVLTTRGWIRWGDCRASETFAVPDPTTHTYRFERLEVFHFPINEELHTFQNNRMSYKVTSAHKMWFKSKYGLDYEKIAVSEMSLWGWFEPLTEYNAYANPYNIFTSAPEPDNWFRFIGFYLGDGSYASTNRINFHLKKPGKLNYLLHLIHTLNLTYTTQESSSHGDGDAIVVSITTPDFLRQWIDVKSRSWDKAFCLDRLEELSFAQKFGLLEGLSSSDGSAKVDRNQMEFSSVSKELIDLMQALAPMLGYDAHVVRGSVGVYHINMYPSGRTSLESRADYHSREHYSGNVFCATTSTGFLAVRGSSDTFGFVCGNSTPFEMCEIKFHVKLPIFVARQWIRHRTACLAGDVKLTFDLPGGISRRGNQAYTLTVKEIFDRFQPTQNATRPDKQRYPFHSRDRIRGMMLRSCDELQMTPRHTSIIDVWESGLKPIYRLDFGDGKILRASEDHLCLTNMGWLRLIEAVNSGAWFTTTSRSSGRLSYTPEFMLEDQEAEEWQALPSCPKYEISTMGRVRSLFNTQNNQLQYPEIKEQTCTPEGYLVVSLSTDSVSRTYFVHHLVLETFCSEPRDGRQTRHRDDNRANNRLGNIHYGTALDNAGDRLEHGTNQRLCIGFTQPLSCVEDGVEMTYDLSVIGPHHNFCAGGVYVHNSVNEYSARYSILDKEFYIPEPAQLAAQSTINRQGRGLVLEGDEATNVLAILRDDAERNYDHYVDMLNEGDTITDPDPNRSGLARELARMNLTLNTYTQWYWKVNLHNLFHFLGLRADSHAQYEIRVYAEAMLEMVKAWVPVSTQAFIDYEHQAKKVSRMEVNLLRDFLGSKLDWDMFCNAAGGFDGLAEKYGMGKREIREFAQTFIASET